MGVKITDMTTTTANGTEIVPTSKGGAPRSVTTASIKNYVVDQIEAITPSDSVAAGNDVVMVKEGALSLVDLDVVLQRALTTMWGKANETPVDADKIPLYDASASAEKTVTLAALATYVGSAVRATLLNASTLDDGASAKATTDYLIVTQGTTAKRIQVSDLSTLIYAALATHVTGKDEVSTAAGTDLLYLVRSGSGYKVPLSKIAALVAASATISGSGTAGRLAQWSGTGTLQAGPEVATATFAAGASDQLASTLAVRTELGELIKDSQDVGAALEGTDTILVDDGANGTQRKSALSRVWTYILAQIQALTSLAGFGFLVDEDDMASDSATKVPSQQSVKAYVDSLSASPFQFPTYTVAALPDEVAGQVIYVSDGAAGSPVLAFSDGTNWLRCDTLAAVSGA